MSGNTGFSTANPPWISDNSDRPPLIEGMIIKGSGSGLYVVDNGRKRLITSPSVYISCGYKPNTEVRVSDTALSLMLTGSNVSARPCPYTLMQAPGDAAIYVVLRGIKRHIVSPDILNACGYNPAHVVVGPLPSGTGTALSSPPCPYVRWPWHSDSVLEGALVKGSGAAIYVVDLSGKRHITSPSVFGACGYSGNDVVTIGDPALGLIPTSSSLFGQPCPNSLVQPPGSSGLYVIENLVKRHIGSPDVYLGCGYNERVIANPPGDGTALIRPPCPYTRD